MKKTKKTLLVGIEPDGTFFLASFIVGTALLGLLLTASAEGIGLEAERATLSFSQPSVKTPFERSLDRMVEGHPIGRMVPSIARRDPVTASFLVAIAKHESNWGKRSPQMDGKTCYNYWGYRGDSESVTSSGYSCFDTPQQAVAVVGRRLDYLISDLHLDTPEELLVWKCGSSCDGHNTGDVERWARNVGLYSKKVAREANL